MCRSDAPEIARILLLLAEQTQRFKTEGLTCTECGTTTTLDTQNTDMHKGISISCSQCKTSLAQCKTMESAGISPEFIEHAHKLVEIKRNATENLGQYLETNKAGKQRTCTTRDRQLTQRAFYKLEAEGIQDSEVGVSLIGTANTNIIKDIVNLGHSMFCYMQEDLPELLQQTNKAQASDTTQALKEMNQKIRDNEQARAEQAQHRKDFSKTMKDVKKENQTHAEKVIEIKAHLEDIEMKSAQAQTALTGRLQQLTQMTDPITQTDYREEALMMAGELGKELGRLNREIEKHNQFEKTQIEALQRASKQRDTVSSEGTPSLQIETREMETKRESNKAQPISRRKDITTFLRATEL